MRRKQDVFQRLGALLLAIVMVVGMCPMQAAAEEGEPIPFKYKIACTPIKADESEEAEVTGYDYTVEFVGTDTPKDGTVKYYWYIEGVTLKAEDDDYYTDERDDNVYVKGSRTMHTEGEHPHTVKVNVMVDGMTLLGTMIGSDSQVWTNTSYTNPFTWGVKETGDITAHVGVPFKLPAAEPDGNSGLNGKEIETKETISGISTDTMDGMLIPTTQGETGTVTREYFVNGTLRARETVSVAVTWPNYNAVFTIGGEDYRSGDTAYVSALPESLKITIPAGSGVVDARYLPGVGGEWTKASDGSFTATVENPDSTITLAARA